MTDWPAELNIDNWALRDHLETSGDRVAIHLDHGALTFREVDSMATDYAISLSESGVVPRDRVLIVMTDGAPYVGALFSCFRTGAVAVMVNPTLAHEAMVGMVRRAKATAAFVDKRFQRAFETARAEAAVATEMIDPDSIQLSENNRFETIATSPEDPAMWLFSGGTTGEPKAVPQTHRSLVNTTRLYGQGTLGLTADDITISVPKLYFGYATGSNLIFPFSVGASTVLFDTHPTPDVLFEKIEQFRPTVMVNVPSAINQMVSHPEASSADLSSLRLTTSAGEALPETLYHQWKEIFGVELLDGLGTAEMWHIFVSNRIGDVKPGTLGKVVPGYEIMVCDDDGGRLPTGEVGRLWVRGESLGLGYFEDPDRTAEAFVDGWFAGGDLVSMDEDGYVTHRGRGDDAIKVKGKWFRPQEVESILLDHDSVAEVAVVAVSDDAGLSKPVAFVVSSSDVTEQELIDWVLERLDAYKHPRRVYLVEKLPQTHLGKVNRSELKKWAV